MSPDGPEHFDVYAKLAAVFAPALVLQGTGMRSRSSMRPRLPRLWEMASLRVLPGTHGLPVELPEVVNPLLVSFPARSVVLLN